ncbi:MFS transporter [Trichophyton tonsurans CBS 112818]|uniref:MFS transporter n=1 Tax=Trichophyton tonsurans (strain CBS 112818) TaxID=647933 RepID=F2RZK3_TRIT1|nr:MFS transporter [Trichophyton tonsurans CBS 112818]
MALGILEDSKLDNVPGTTYVLDDDGSSVETPVPEESHLKYDKSGSVPIILVPQPSDDPNDPLNWPLWKRDLILVILSITSVICATTSSIMAANTVTIALNYTIDFTQAALLTGYHLCGVGVAGIIIVPTARVWGKRHLFLLGNLIVVISCIWAGLSKRSHTSLIWARIWQGVGLAPFEALVNAVVGDLFFVHERGKRMASQRMDFYFIAIFSGACLPFVYFFVPETAYRRAQHLNTDFSGDVDRRTARAAAQETIEKEVDADSAAGPSSAAVAANGDTAQPEVPRKATFVESLALFNGRKTDESFWKLLLRPFPLFLHPSIAWACLIQGVIIGWTVFIGVVLAAIFLGPPLWFTEEQTGYLYTGAFIGSVVGLFLSGLFSDWSANLLIRANKGKYEPEFRIWLVLPQLVFSGIGLFGFGFASGNVVKYGWVIPDVFFMFVLIGMVMGAVASALYIVDAHREIAIEAFTCLLVFKNMFSFLLTYFAYNWVVLGGAKKVFLIIGGIEVAVCLLSVPMYVFGKRNRSFFHRYDILKMLNLW